ncbi:winged helix-turn-helix domain-containing protein [Natrarchaeobaculum sulfurireducens]|uniref:Transcriptional regulator containing HTH domain,ArsR family n=1 Tax=Natrarchaeobaculum sulfurireducens TaxID=2044521 RepID=A0A346PBY5_9EURY|nr:helix-turn-helix domain-containing protein [Natrarchaeobaculum sulfurireducens]AXR77030.1 Transcriptional regulator containing HTH domain,ArsR family [Natrarchaeobaculum sulfurireducens]
MARLFPFRSETPSKDGAPRVVDLEGEDADAVFGALSSTTARRIYARLDDEPGTPSDVADAIDSSIQNVRYHLEKLEDAGLVEVVDTWYSSRGNEMSVYATTDGPLIVTSDESTASQLKAAISRLIGAIGALAGGSLMVQYGLTRWFEPGVPAGTEDAAPPPGDELERDVADEPDDADEDVGIAETGDDATEPDDEAADEPETDVVEDDAPDDDTPEEDAGEPPAEDELDAEPVADEVEPDAIADGGVEAAEAVFSTVPPGLLFFLGGLVVLLAVTAYWYWSRPAY